MNHMKCPPSPAETHTSSRPRSPTLFSYPYQDPLTPPPPHSSRGPGHPTLASCTMIVLSHSSPLSYTYTPPTFHIPPLLLLPNPILSPSPHLSLYRSSLYIDFIVDFVAVSWGLVWPPKTASLGRISLFIRLFVFSLLKAVYLRKVSDYLSKICAFSSPLFVGTYGDHAESTSLPIRTTCETLPCTAPALFSFV